MRRLLRGMGQRGNWRRSRKKPDGGECLLDGVLVWSRGCALICLGVGLVRLIEVVGRKDANARCAGWLGARFERWVQHLLGLQRERRAALCTLVEGGPRHHISKPHRMKEDYPLNLSISLSGGEEKNLDTPSNGE